MQPGEQPLYEYFPHDCINETFGNQPLRTRKAKHIMSNKINVSCRLFSLHTVTQSLISPAFAQSRNTTAVGYTSLENLAAHFFRSCTTTCEKKENTKN